jgi:hypothetical protein
MGTPKPRGQIFNKDLERGEADSRGNEGSLSGRGSRLWNGPPTSPAWAQMPSLNDLDPGHYFYGREDFLLSPSALSWVPMTDGSSGTDIHQDAVGGVMSLVTAASQDDYKAYRTPRKFFKFASGKEAAAEIKFKLTEATTNDSAIWFGMLDTVTTGGFQSGASGPLASYDGALVYKDQDSMSVNFEVSNAGSQSTLAAFATAGSGSWSRMAFYFDGVDKFSPYFSIDDGVTWTAGTPQTIRPSLTGMDEMYLVFGTKAGPGAAAETLQVDFVQWMQLR